MGEQRIRDYVAAATRDLQSMSEIDGLLLARRRR